MSFNPLVSMLMGRKGLGGKDDGGFLNQLPLRGGLLGSLSRHGLPMGGGMAGRMMGGDPLQMLMGGMGGMFGGMGSGGGGGRMGGMRLPTNLGGFGGFMGGPGGLGGSRGAGAMRGQMGGMDPMQLAALMQMMGGMR